MKSSNWRAKAYPYWNLFKMKGGAIANYAVTTGINRVSWANYGYLT